MSIPGVPEEDEPLSLKQTAGHGTTGSSTDGGLLALLNWSVKLKFRVVSRKQTTMSNAKLNRLLKRGTITGDQVKAYTAKMCIKSLDNPYLELESGSNGHRHRRYLEFGPLLDNPVAGTFDQFGLSKTATIPWF